MKSLRVTLGEAALVSFVNSKGERCALPLIKVGKEWRSTGSYLKYGLSKSDPLYGAVFPLPINYKPGGKILLAIGREKQK